MPEKPFASTFARSAIVARTARTGRGSPTPAAWLRSRFSWSAPSASRGIGGLGERAEAGIDAVDRLAAVCGTIDHLRAMRLPAGCVRRQRDRRVVVGNRRQLFERER